MSRIEPKLSSPMGGEFSLHGNAPGLSGSTRNSISFGWTAPEVQLVGADNAVKGVLREMARSTVRESRRFVFAAADSQRETPLPSRVSTLDDAKAFVRRHLADGQWRQPLGQTAGTRHGTLGEAQLFGASGQARPTQTTIAESAWKKPEASASLPDAAAARSQLMPSLIRTAAETQRHVVLDPGKSAQKNQNQTQIAAPTTEKTTEGVVPIEPEAVQAPATANTQQRSDRIGIKAHQLNQNQDQRVSASTIILTSSGEVFGQPKASVTASPGAEEKHDVFPLALLATLLATVTLIAFSALTFYLWGPRQGGNAIREASFAAPNTTFPATPGLPSVNVARPETTQRSAQFEAQNETSARKTVQSGRKNKGATKCSPGSASGDAEAACPNTGQAPNSSQ
jgi:hypothetical protein